MSIQSILKRLSYCHKLSAIRYFLLDPRLVFGIPTDPTKTHVASVLERAARANIIQALQRSLPEWFLAQLGTAEVHDPAGYGLMLYLLVRTHKPQVAVETGVGRGVSSAHILCAMQENNTGHLYSIDLPPEQAAVAKCADDIVQLADGQRHHAYNAGECVPDRLKDKWSLIVGDSKEQLPALLRTIKRIDMFFHDSLHTYEHMKFEYETAWPYLSDGGLMLSHDVVWNKAFYEQCREHHRKAVIYRSLGIVRK